MSASAVSLEEWKYLRKLTGLTPPIYATTDEVVAREDNARAGTSRVGAAEEVLERPSVSSDDDHQDADQAAIAPVVPERDHDDHNDNEQNLDRLTPEVDPATALPDPLPEPTEIHGDSASSHQQAGDAVIVPARAPDAGPADPPLQTPTIFQTMAAYGPAVTDGAAAAFSLAAVLLSHSPLDAKVTGAFSGGLWALGATWQERHNKPRNYVVSAANFLGCSAGLLSLVAVFVLADDTKKVAYASAAAWAANGFANLMRAGARTGGPTAVDYWLAGCGLANLSAAIVSGVEAHVAAADESRAATDLGTISAAFWLVGAITAVAAVYAAGLGNRGMPPLPDPEAGGEAMELPTRGQAPMTE
jgi:hypothetical protein